MAVNLAADVHRLGFAKYDASVVFFRCPHEPLCLPFGRFAKSEYFGIGLQPRQPLLATLLEFGFLRFETMARFDGVADAIDKRTAGLPEQVADGGGIGIVPAKRCDAGCTVDSARVLRVPGTWNCKNGLQRPVKLLWIGQDFDF